MVYGRILYNNIKEYTPKWFKTVPYGQTARPTFSIIPSLFVARGKQVESALNSKAPVKNFWRLFGRTVQANPWMWQVFIFAIAFGWFHIVYDPFLTFYRLNNKHVRQLIDLEDIGVCFGEGESLQEENEGPGRCSREMIRLIMMEIKSEE